MLRSAEQRNAKRRSDDGGAWDRKNDSAWYLDNGYFRPQKRRALRKLRLKLLAEIWPDAFAYIDSFAIPDFCLSAPIAFEDYIGRKPLKTGKG